MAKSNEGASTHSDFRGAEMDHSFVFALLLFQNAYGGG